MEPSPKHTDALEFTELGTGRVFTMLHPGGSDARALTPSSIEAPLCGGAR